MHVSLHNHSAEPRESLRLQSRAVGEEVERILCGAIERAAAINARAEVLEFTRQLRYD